jgi:hypothetical protein
MLDRQQEARPVPFAGRFNAASDPVRVARHIHDVLSVDVEHRY